MKGIFLFFMMLVFASPGIQACDVYGVWELDSDIQQYTMHFSPKGTVNIQISDRKGRVAQPKAFWKCENDLLTVYRSDASIIKRVKLLFIAGSVTTENRQGRQEVYVFEPGVVEI